MHHTVIEVADTPAGRAWLASPVHVHQRLCMAWPDGQTDRRMLWRIQDGEVLVQTVDPVPSPDRWRLDVDFLTRRPMTSEWEPDFRRGAVYPFTLRCNPVRQCASGAKRALTSWSDIGWWLGRMQADMGVHVLSFDARREGRIHIPRSPDRYPCVYLPVEYTGRALCMDAEALARAVRAGVGKGKAFGLGLLVLGEPEIQEPRAEHRPRRALEVVLT